MRSPNIAIRIALFGSGIYNFFLDKNMLVYVLQNE